jgi:hypothetical protein
MAKVTLETTYIMESLVDLAKKILDAIAWVPIKQQITLEIPEPFDHPVRDHKPAAGPPCGVGPILEECSDIGILLGVLGAMTGAGKKGSGTKGKTKPRK